MRLSLTNQSQSIGGQLSRGWSLTCCLAWNLESFLQRLERDDEVDVAHRLEGAEKAINEDEAFRRRVLLEELWMAAPPQST